MSPYDYSIATGYPQVYDSLKDQMRITLRDTRSENSSDHALSQLITSPSFVVVTDISGAEPFWLLSTRCRKSLLEAVSSRADQFAGRVESSNTFNLRSCRKGDRSTLQSLATLMKQSVSDSFSRDPEVSWAEYTLCHSEVPAVKVTLHAARVPYRKTFTAGYSFEANGLEVQYTPLEVARLEGCYNLELERNQQAYFGSVLTEDQLQDCGRNHPASKGFHQGFVDQEAFTTKVENFAKTVDRCSGRYRVQMISGKLHLPTDIIHPVTVTCTITFEPQNLHKAHPLDDLTM